MRTSAIGFLMLAMAGTNWSAQGPDPELGKLNGTWIASGVWHNGQRKMGRASARRLVKWVSFLIMRTIQVGEIRRVFRLYV